MGFDQGRKVGLDSSDRPGDVEAFRHHDLGHQHEHQHRLGGTALRETAGGGLTEAASVAGGDQLV